MFDVQKKVRRNEMRSKTSKTGRLCKPLLCQDAIGVEDIAGEGRLRLRGCGSLLQPPTRVKQAVLPMAEHHTAQSCRRIRGSGRLDQTLWPQRQSPRSCFPVLRPSLRASKAPQRYLGLYDTRCANYSPVPYHFSIIAGFVTHTRLTTTHATLD